MKTLIRFIGLTVLTSFVIVSCSGSPKYGIGDAMEVSMMSIPEEEYAPSSINDEKAYVQQSVRFVPPVIQDFIATSRATTVNDDENHKFIRTATLKFKVKDVVSATSAIEDVIIKNKGFIIRSAINNKESVSGEYELSKDSVLVITNNCLEGNLDLKVPKDILDATLREIAPLAIHIDYRVVDAEDVTVKLLSDKLEQERMAKKQKRIGGAIGSRSGKLEEAMDAEERMDGALEQSDRAYLSSFVMNEKIAYSAIKINVYQEPIVDKKVVYTPSYEPGFGSKLSDGFAGGWNIICQIFLFFVGIWPITLVLLGSVALLYWKYIRKTGK
jgi:hypothetical protein